MTPRPPVFTLALVLLGILGIATLLMVLGQRDANAFPSAVSFQPSGSAALRQLLADSGFEVVVDRAQEPDLTQHDLAIVFFVKRSMQSRLFQSDEEVEEAQRLAERIERFARTGGSVISLPLREDFGEASVDTMPKRVALSGPGRETASVSWGGAAETGMITSEGESAYDLWSGPRGAFVRIKSIGKGSEVLVSDGIVATNRFIDQAENAKVLLAAIFATAKPDSRIVFVEAAFGNALELSLTDIIGSWAKAAWMQALLLGAVVMYTLGKPFGLPCAERRTQRSTRELLDAMAETMMRGKMSRVALGSARDEARRLVTRRFGSEAGAARTHEDPTQVEALRKGLALIESALDLDPPEDRSVSLVADLDAALRELEPRKRDLRPTR